MWAPLLEQRSDGVHPSQSGHAVYSWRSATPVRHVPETFDPPVCSCGHILVSHRRGPGLGCAVAACLCLEDGDTPPTRRPELSRREPPPDTSWLEMETIGGWPWRRKRKTLPTPPNPGKRERR